MVRIRLKRIGMRHRPTYRIVAIEKRRSRDGRYLESFGHYDPRTKLLQLDLERVKHWISKGAQPSDTVEKLIRRYEKAREAGGSVTDMAAKAAEAAVLIPDPPEIAAAKHDDMEAPAEMAVAVDAADEPEPATEPESATGTETPTEAPAETAPEPEAEAEETPKAEAAEEPAPADDAPGPDSDDATPDEPTKADTGG